MPKFDFDPKLSWGNVLTMAVMVAGLIIGWQTLAGETADHGNSIVSLGIRVDATDNRLAALINEFQADRVSSARILTEMATDLRYLREAIDEARGR